MNKKIIVAVVIIVILLAGGIYLSYKPSKKTILPTYFSYSEEELGELDGLSSSLEMKARDLYELDTLAFDLTRKNTVVSGFDPNTSKVYVYLALAERDAAYISQNLKGKFAGTLTPLAKEVLCLFFLENCSQITPGVSDAYSEALSKIVLAKVKARASQDEANLKPYAVKSGPEYWDGFEPMIGIADGSRKPWSLTRGDQFRASRPPAFGSEEFKEQLALTKAALQNVTEQQKQAVVFWAGGPGTKTPPGIWLEIADNYMQEKGMTFQKALQARASLTMALADGVIAVFDSKYTYWTRRPFMEDPSLITIMPTPNHPSYPAGHSVLSMAAGKILSYYFPENEAQWLTLAEEGGTSRVWGGIHYPMDHEAGKSLGEKVAAETLKHGF